MSRRSSSTNRIDSGISRKIGSDLSKVIVVADNIEAVLAAASVDLEALLDALTEATDFAGITVVPGENAHWDPVTKILTVPTVKGDKGDAGEDLRIVSITPNTGGSFIWEFSDGTTYTTPNLRGNKGDQGDKGDKGDSVELTSIDYQGEGVFVWSFSDGTVYQTPSLKGVKGDQGDQGDKGDQGDPITMEASIYQGDGSFLWKFSDGSTYRTPDLRGVRGFKGDKGDKGDQGVSVHHLKGTLTTHDGAKFGMEGETDTYTFYGDAHETIVLGWFKIQNGYNTRSYAETAVENAALAEKWASEAVGVPVKDGKYSAYHHATKAALSETAAKDSETAAGISEGIATTAASTAVDAADTAVTASDEAEASLKDFRERYYGRYTTAPTVNPYGGPIELGDLYFDEVYQELKVWAEVGGTAVWKYAGAGPKGDNFSVHKVGLRSERSLYDNEAQGFCFFATDETVVTGPLKSVHLPYSSTNEYLLEGFAGGPLSLVVTINGIVQSPAAYTVTDSGGGDYILGISVEANDILIARELGRAFTNGAAYFKLSEVSADWSDPVPFSQGPKGDKGDKGDTGGVEEAPADGVQYARKNNVWAEVVIPVNDVTSVSGKTGDVLLDKADVGLSNVDNTSDLNKPVSNPTQAALNDKVDKVTGKGLSDTNFTQAEKSKLAALESSRWKGKFVSLSALQSGVTNPEVGDYADVDSGVGEDIRRFIYDADDAVWVEQSGVVADLTGAQIKALYEAEPDTNAFSDSDASKLAALPTNQILAGLLDDKASTDDSRLSNSREWTAPTISQSEAEAGTATTRRAFTAQRVRQAIVAWFNGISGALGRTILSRTTAAQVRSDIGLGTASTKDVGESAGNVMEVGAFGLGITSTPNTVADDKDIRELASGIYSLNKTHFQSIATDGSVLWVGMRVGTNSTFILHQASNNKMWISTKYSNPTGDISWAEIYHTENIPTTATRWPTFAEVTSKPIIQTTGTSTTNIMSQKAVTDVLSNKVDKVTGKGLIEPAPEDGKQYARKDASWVEVTGGNGDVEEAPIDGKQYARKDAEWVEVVASGSASTPVVVVDNPSGYQMESGSTYVITSLNGQGSALLPANPSNGDIITILDGDGGFGGSDGDTFNLISDHPIIGSTTESESHTFTFNVKWVGIKLLFVNSTLGWINYV